MVEFWIYFAGGSVTIHDQLDIVIEKKKDIKNDPKVFGLNDEKNGATAYI